MSKDKTGKARHQKTTTSSKGEAAPHPSGALKEEKSKKSKSLWERIPLFLKILGGITALIVAITGLINATAGLKPNSFPIPASLIFTSTPLLPTDAPVIPSQSTILSTSTPVPFAVVQSFVVLENGKTTIYKPHEIVDMKTGWHATIRADVSNNIPIEELEFTWTFCQMRETISGKGVFAIPYTSSNLAGQDCIRVKIWKEGHMLSDNFIFINTRD